MRAIVIEDEINVRNGFIKLMNVFCPEIEVIATAESVETGLQAIKTHECDILFLDINLPDGSGFDLIYQIEERSFETIFVTAYDQYAIDAFKIGAVDYLLKPVAPDLLKTAIHRVKSQKAITVDSSAISAMKSHLDQQYNQQEKMILRDTDSMHIVSVGDIIYCHADGAYTTFAFSNRDPITTSLHLKEYERLLEAYGFIRCHNSYLANMQHVLELKKVDGGTMIMSDQSQLPLSTRKRPQVVEALKKKFLSY